MDTITALATPYGNGAISIIRVSGADCLAIAKKVFSAPSLDYAKILPRHMYLGSFDASTIQDKCFMVYFKAPNSFNGEDMLEFHCHGGMRLVEEVLQVLIESGARLADKGELTKRAFLNGKLSLSEAEGIVDMINAESRSALNAGYRLLNGDLTKRVREINDKILDLCSSLEASLDYPEELEEEARDNAVHVLSHLHIDLKTLLSTAKTGKVIRNGINVAIIGRPNVGKSSLLNAITRRNKAIVTDIPGTTRDVIEERIEYNNIMINFLDTAGIRNTCDIVEKIGVDRAEEAANSADFVIILLDAATTPNADEQRLINKFADKPHIIAYNKADGEVLPSNKNALLISAKNNTNIDNLLNNITQYFMNGSIDSSGVVLTEMRHIQAIARALDYIKSANYSSADALSECLLVDLKAAYYSLGEITGDTANENIIDRIFEKFCLGK